MSLQNIVYTLGLLKTADGYVLGINSDEAVEVCQSFSRFQHFNMAQAPEIQCTCPIPGRMDIAQLNKQLREENLCKIHGEMDHSLLFVIVNAELVARRRAALRRQRLKREAENRRIARAAARLKREAKDRRKSA